jgi:general secretion pathway protein C
MEFVDRIVAPMRRPGTAGRGGMSAAAPTLVTLVLVILIAAQLAALLWRALGSGNDPELLPTPVVDVNAAQAADLPAIVNAHLFGVAQNSGDPSDAPATSANLALADTLAGSDPSTGWAIIGASGQSARVYATGSTLPGGTKLVSVYPDRVIIDRSGARESLLMPRLSGGPAGTAYAPQVAQAQLAPDDLVRQVMSQESTVGELLRPQPVYAGGQLRGFRVYPGRDRALFARTGLQPGDLVMAINGAALDDPQRGIETLRGIGQGASVTVTIDRNGEPQQLTIDSAAVQMPQELQPTEETEPEESEATE